MSSSHRAKCTKRAFWEAAKRYFSCASGAMKLLFIVTLCYGSFARAEGASEPVLSARPGLCILKDEDSAICEMAVELIWNSALADSFCLHSSATASSLRCWRSAREGQHHFELSSREGVEFWLQRPSSDIKLAQITLRIVSLAQRNPQRRRRRHVWSVL